MDFLEGGFVISDLDLNIEAFDSDSKPPPRMMPEDLFPPVQAWDCYNYYGTVTAIAEIDLGAASLGKSKVEGMMDPAWRMAVARLGSNYDTTAAIQAHAAINATASIVDSEFEIGWNATAVVAVAINTECVTSPPPSSSALPSPTLSDPRNRGVYF